MRLRRIIEHLRNQDWTAVGIDFVIVVIGVFVGIQVANWNTERETDQRAAVFTERLKSDLREEAWAYEFLFEYTLDVQANAERTVDALSGRADLSNEALLVSAYRATQYKQRTRRRATYDELISTGTIGLIRDEGLRDLTMRLYAIPAIDHAVREGMQSRFREAFRMAIPNHVQRALSRDCGDREIQIGDFEGILDNIDYPCELDLPQAEIDAAAQVLRADPNLVPLLRLRIADMGTRLHDLKVNNRAVAEGLQAILKEQS